MAATKTLEERKKDFITRLSNLYPDYRLISDYVDGDTFIELLHVPSKEVWKTKPRYLNGVRQAPGVAKANKPKTKKHKFTQQDFENKFYQKWSKREYKVVGTYVKAHEPIEIVHLKCGKSFFPTPNNMIYTNKKGCKHCYGKTKKDINDYQNIFNKHKELKDYTILKIFSKDGHVYGNIRHNCDKCSNYEFNIRISDMVSKHRQRCPLCMQLERESKAVKDITNLLEDMDINFKKEVKFKSCRHINLLPFDFYLKDYRAIIEYDGVQHFKASGFITQEKVKNTQRNDKIKDKWCNDKKINLLRIKYNEDHISKVKKFLKTLNCSV